MAYELFPRPRNQRLPMEHCCDPERVVFLTVRASEFSSPFAAVQTLREAAAGEAPAPEMFDITFNQPLCQLVLDLLKEAKETYGCYVLVACLMPDHLHWLARPRTTQANVLTMQDRFKGKSTNKSWKLGHHGRLWQPRSFDHVLRREESVIAAAEYILNNPVRKRYVKQWQDWPNSVRWDLVL